MPNLSGGPYEAFADNVLLPKGNYAVRITRDDNRILLWNFYISGDDNSSGRILPPPVELKHRKDGTLFLASYSGFENKRTGIVEESDLLPLRRILMNPTAKIEEKPEFIEISSVSGYEIYYLNASEGTFAFAAGFCWMDWVSSEWFCGRMRARAVITSASTS